eukprot:scaffold9726_cov119-Isochrysis_galbana.AAC.30
MPRYPAVSPRSGGAPCPRVAAEMLEQVVRVFQREKAARPSGGLLVLARARGGDGAGEPDGRVGGGPVWTEDQPTLQHVDRNGECGAGAHRADVLCVLGARSARLGDEADAHLERHARLVGHVHERLDAQQRNEAVVAHLDSAP